MIETFAATAVTLYVAHHVGDYWVQTDVQARGKGQAGHAGRVHCLSHVLSYVATQAFLLAMASTVLDMDLSGWGALAGLAVSGVTHYMADRREHGQMVKLARLLGMSGFLSLGVPRRGQILVHLDDDPTMERVQVDNPQLATGAWALDQSWHIFWGVWVAGLLVTVL